MVFRTAAAALAALVLWPSGTPPAADRREIVVSQDGRGDTTTIQAALDLIPRVNAAPRVVVVRPGTYREKLFVGSSHVSIVGEDRDRTRIEYPELRRIWRETHPDDWGAAVVNIADGVSDLSIANLTVHNTYGSLHGDRDHQFAIRGGHGVTRIVLLEANVIADGGDTLSLWNTDSGLYYHANSYFEGWVDYVCPRGWCYITNSRFVGHSTTASLWHDGSLHQDARLVVRRSSIDGDPGFALGRHNRDGQFYVLDCVFGRAMADRPIYGPSPRDSYRWGDRAYYANDRRDGGDFGWFADNLAQAPGAPAPREITAAWTFGGRWDPVRSIPAVLPFAAVPDPEDRDADVAASGVTLRWTAARGATAHIVRFGTSDVPPIIRRQTSTECRLGPLRANTAYYWRVDEVTAAGTVPGRAWTFRTRD